LVPPPPDFGVVGVGAGLGAGAGATRVGVAGLAGVDEEVCTLDDGVVTG
jgi:hypothetical protein